MIPIERIAACGHLREYHQWQWDEGNQDSSYPGYPNHQLAWSPSWVSGPGWGWDFDAFYRQLKDAGVEVSPCFQGCAPYLVGFDRDRTDEKPVAGQDPTQPQSYIAHASYLFQFAARYGSTPLRQGPAQAQTRPARPKRPGPRAVHGELERAGQVVEGPGRVFLAVRAGRDVQRGLRRPQASPGPRRRASRTPIRI